MLSKRPRRLSYANMMSTIAVVLALSAGTAYAANEWTGANIVNESLTGADVRGKAGTASKVAANGSLTTFDISGQQADRSNGTPFVDGTITTWDVKDGSLSPRDLPLNSIGSERILDGTVQTVDLGQDSVDSSKVAKNALTGDDVNESTLGQVPSALLGGMGRSAEQGEATPCNPNHDDGMANVCAFLEIELPHSARVLLVGSARATSADAVGSGGTCYLGSSQSSVIAGSQAEIDIQGMNASKYLPLVAVTTPLNPGPVSFWVACTEFAGDMRYIQSKIAAVALSAN